MKSTTALLLSLALVAVSCKKETAVWQTISSEYVSTSEAPFPMSDVQAPIFPDQKYPITDYGAIALPVDGSGFPTSLDSSRVVRVNAKAFADAMADCSASGGGYVVVPKGEWLTGPVKFQSSCNLYLSEGSVLVFSGKPDDYLPEEMSPWEGVECVNYCPLVYAYRCSKVGISGTGTLRPIMTEWEKWFELTPEHVKGLQILDRWGTFGEKWYKRNISGHKFQMRPPLVQFFQCTNVLLEDFKVRQSPQSSIHLYGCEEGVARRLDVCTFGRGCDGLVLEMTRSFVVEDCTFEQGGDAMSLKSGRVYESWNSQASSHNILIRRCVVKRGKALLSIGEEVSHGIHNVYMTDCKATGAVDDLLSVRSNIRQGSSVDSIFVANCEAASLQRVFAIDTDVWGDWRDAMSHEKDTINSIGGILMHDVKCRSAVALVDINGDKKNPAKDITIRNISADSVYSYVSQVNNAEDVKISDIQYGWLGKSSKSPIRPE